MTDSPHDESMAARLKADADLAAAALDEQYRARLCRLVEGDEASVSPQGGPGRRGAIGLPHLFPPQRHG